MSLEPNEARNEHTWALTHLFYTHFERKSLFLSLPQTESSFAIWVSLHMNLKLIWMWQKDSLNNKKEKRPHSGGRKLSSITVSFQRRSVRELRSLCRMQLLSQLNRINTKAHSLPSFMPLRFFIPISSEAKESSSHQKFILPYEKKKRATHSLESWHAIYGNYTTSCRWTV